MQMHPNSRGITQVVRYENLNCGDGATPFFPISLLYTTDEKLISFLHFHSGNPQLREDKEREENIHSIYYFQLTCYIVKYAGM